MITFQKMRSITAKHVLALFFLFKNEISIALINQVPIKFYHFLLKKKKKQKKKT